MIRVEKWLHGLVKKETEVFFSRRLDHIEIVETTKVFGYWKIFEDTREVFIPNTDIRNQAQMKVIADAFSALYETLQRLEEIE